MIPVMQTFTHGERGDCLRACVASLLELPIEDVPNFAAIPGDGKWFNDEKDGLWYFLLRHGAEYCGVQNPEKAMELSPGIDGYFIATVKSVNFSGKEHALIFQGRELAHDPSPIKKWQGSLADVRGFYMIKRRDRG